MEEGAHAGDVAPAAARRDRRWIRVAALVVALAAAVGLLVVARAKPWRLPRVADARPLFVRTTPDGVTIEAEQGMVTYPARWVDGAGALVEGPRTAHGMLVHVTLADGRSSVLAVPDRAPSDDDIMQTFQIGLGIPPGDARWMLRPVRASPRVAKVRVRLADGRWDEMAPVEGYAVFATVTGFDHMAPFEAFDAGGARIDPCSASPAPLRCGQ